jgi:hypothetical protein
MMTREIYIEKLASRLNRWNAYLGKLEKKAGDFTGELKTSFDKQLADIRTRRDAVNQKLEEIKSSGEGAWETFRKGAKEARGKLVEAFTKAHDQVHEFIASEHN